MSVMFCRHEPVKHPFYIEPLGIHIWSSQELCYVIYNNPLLVLEDFVDDHLIAFIREELDMEYLAAKLEKLIKSGEDNDQLLLVILSECSYYSAAEQNRFHQEVAALKKLSPAQYAKRKGDYMFSLKQYGKAAAIYGKILESPKDPGTEPGFVGKVWCNLGCAYARMFQFDRASSAFYRAYLESKDQEILKRMYFLTRVHSGAELKEPCRSAVTRELAESWAQEVEEAKEMAKASESVLKIEGLFEKDPIKRMAGASKLVKQWKQEYRGMI